MTLKPCTFFARKLRIEVGVVEVHDHSLSGALENEVSLNGGIVAKLPPNAILLLKLLPELLHILSKRLLKITLEVKFAGDFIRNGRDIQQNHHDVRLLAVVARVVLAVLDEFLALVDVRAEVGEAFGVLGVAEDGVPGRADNSLLGHVRVIQNLQCLRVFNLKTVIVPHIVTLLNNLISLVQSHGREEVWQVLVHPNLVLLEGEAPLLQVLVRDHLLEQHDDGGEEYHEEERRGLRDLQVVQKVIAFHLFCLLHNITPLTLEHLLVVNEPESIENQKHRRPPQLRHRIVAQVIVHGRRLSDRVRNLDPLREPLRDQGSCCKWKQDRHPQAIHHGDVADIEHVTVLEVDQILRTGIHRLEVLYRGFFRPVWIPAETVVEQALQGWHGEGDHEVDEGHHAVDEHGLNDF